MFVILTNSLTQCFWCSNVFYFEKLSSSMFLAQQCLWSWKIVLLNVFAAKMFVILTNSLTRCFLFWNFLKHCLTQCFWRSIVFFYFEKQSSSMFLMQQCFRFKKIVILNVFGAAMFLILKNSLPLFNSTLNPQVSRLVVSSNL